MGVQGVVVEGFLLVYLLNYNVSLTATKGPPFFAANATIGRGKRLLVARGKAERLSMFTTSKGALLHSCPFGRAPAKILLSNSGTCIAAFRGAKQLRILSLGSKRVRTTVPANSKTYCPVFSTSGGRVCMYGRFTNAMDRVSPTAYGIIEDIGILHRPESTVFDGSKQCLFITGFLPTRETSLGVITTYMSMVRIGDFAGMGSVRLTGNDGTLQSVYVAPSNGCVCMSRGLKHFVMPASRLRRK